MQGTDGGVCILTKMPFMGMDSSIAYLVELDRMQGNRLFLAALKLEGSGAHLADSVDDVFLCSSPFSSLLIEVL